MTESSQNETPQVTCPSCQQVLVTDGIKLEALVRCAACGKTFFQDSRPLNAARRKAILSLLLGLATPCCFVIAAVPGLLFGLAALRETKHYAQTKLSRWLAIAGIVLSVGFALFCSFSMGFGALVGMMQRTTQEPAAIMELVRERMEIELPEGVEPKIAMQVMGTETFMFSRDRDSAKIMIQSLPSVYGGQSVDRSTHDSAKRNYQGELLDESTIMEDPHEVTRQRIRGGDGRLTTRYISAIRKGDRVLVVVMSRDTPKSIDASGGDDEALAFFRSLTID